MGFLATTVALFLSATGIVTRPARIVGPVQARARVVAVDGKASVTINTAPRSSTLVVLPRGEAIAEILGSTSSQHELLRFLAVRGTGVLHVITASGTEYTLILREDVFPGDVAVFLVRSTS